MNKLKSAIVSMTCIFAFLLIVSFAGGIENELIFPPVTAAQTVVTISQPDKQGDAMQTYTTATPVQHTYIDRKPEVRTEPEIQIPEDEITTMAQMLYGECGSKRISKTKKAACAWVACNRADSSGKTIVHVITAKNQFCGYNPDNEVTEELYDLAKDVLTRWYREKAGEADVGRVIPPEYEWFTGDGRENVFRNAYKAPYDTWDFSLDSPYDT